MPPVSARAAILSGTTVAALLPFSQDPHEEKEPALDVSVMPSTFDNGGVGLSASGIF